MKLSLIVLTNFYPAAQQAVRYADALASTLGSRLVLLHVDRGFHMDPYLFPGEAWRRQALEEQEETGTQLERLAGQLRAPATVAQAPDLEADVLRDLAQRHHPALFVLGQAAPGTAAPEDLNATALQMLRTTQLPVLLVPAGTTAPALPRRVMVAVDSEEFRLTDAAACVSCLLANRDLEPTVVHVSAVEDDQLCTNALRAAQRSGLLAGMPKADLRGYESEHPAEGILAAIRDTQADLVVLPARRRSYLNQLFHRSVTAQVVRQSPVPVLLVPALEPAAPREHAHPHEADDQLSWPRN